MVEKHRQFYGWVDLNLYRKLWFVMFWVPVSLYRLRKNREWISNRGKVVNGFSPIGSDSTHIKIHSKVEKEENNFSGGFGVSNSIMRNPFKSYDVGD